ncbi:MAG: tetratricopeptide repeat protein, partial [Candidatus Heimdallarchaeota archaeon]
MTTFDESIREFIQQGRFHELIDFLERRIPEIPSQQKKLQLEFQLAEAYYSIREFKVSKRLVERIIPLIHDQENHSLLGEAENLLGKIYRLHQRYSEALIHYENAERAFKIGKNKNGLSKIYHNYGNVYIFLERFKEAKEYHSKALQLANQEGNPSAIASCHLSIGTMHYQNGEVDEALIHFEKARNLLEEIQELPSLSVVYLNLSETFLIRNNFKSAREYSSKAAELYAEQKNVLGQQLALTTLARINKAEGTFEEAIETYRQIIKLNPTEVKEEVLLELGECYLAQHQMNEARKSFEKVLELPTHTLQGAGYSLDYLARIAIEYQDFSDAREIYIRLLDVLHKMEPQDPDSIASTQGNLGYMYLKTGDFERAWEFLFMTGDYFKKRKTW